MYYTTAVTIVKHRDDMLKMRSKGGSLNAISGKYGLSISTIKLILQDGDIYDKAKATIVERDDMVKMYLDGATLQEIADEYFYTPQQIGHILRASGIGLNMRGRLFDVNRICYQGIYDYFMEHPDETISSFTCKIYSKNTKSMKIRRFLLGECDSTFSIPILNRICEVVGKSFEETFVPREVEVKE